MFGKTAQVVRDYVTKGKQLYLEGQVTYDEWTDKDGNKRNTTKIKVSGFNGKLVLLGGGGKDRGGYVDETQASAPPAEDFQVSDDDVPF